MGVQKMKTRFSTYTSEGEVKMKFTENAAVLTADHDKAGHLEKLVIDPRTTQVTDVVVGTGLLSSVGEKVVPIRLIDSVQDGEILLHQSVGSLHELPDYVEEHFVPLTGKKGKQLSYAPPIPVLIGNYPYPIPGQPPLPRYVRKETEKNIPEDAVTLELGTPVFDSVGDHVGDIEKVLVGSDTDRISHFVITQGLLLKKRRLVPITWLNRVEEDRVYLAVDRDVLKSLPEYKM